MSFGKMRSRAALYRKVVTRDAEGFSVEEEQLVASFHAYREGRHGTERWANRAAFFEILCSFRFRACGADSLFFDHRKHKARNFYR